MKYLTNIPQEVQNNGFCKVLAVRRETIHIKHIFTEVFVRKSIDIDKYLNRLGMDIFGYMEVMTNRMRRVHHFSRDYVQDINQVVKHDRDRFFPTVKLMEGLNTVIVLDFDGVVTAKKFRPLYDLCIERGKTHICTANPCVDMGYFDKNGMGRPGKISPMKGKIKKIKRLIEIQKQHDYVFYVDNEIEYLEYAWVFGVQTYHWDGDGIKYFSMKSK